MTGRHRPGRSTRLGSALAAAVIAGNAGEAKRLAAEIKLLDARRREAQR